MFKQEILLHEHEHLTENEWVILNYQKPNLLCYISYLFRIMPFIIPTYFTD